jgi:alpha-tubulin suppressor-like RCC1 family protein
LKSDGTVWGTGRNAWGQLGDNTTTRRIQPVQVRRLNNVKQISAGGQTSAFVTTEGLAYGAGRNSNRRNWRWNNYK